MFSEKAVPTTVKTETEVPRNDVVIQVSGLSKCYQIYDKPQDRLKQGLWRGRKQFYREFWALRDVSFEVTRGETVGIIGRNGSGKSTLLQMICGTLTPTTGEIEVNGRIAALLELGAGFSPEFTGRENVYMNAALYGLTQDEIDAKFDHIAGFADIGDFIDQPVKTYSSGMYVRLAFAVIAHVDADILIIDEALAVGDAVFTQKCMRYLRRFMGSGTLIFVSHDSASVVNLCKQAIWLAKGEVKLRGDAKTVTEAYLHANLQDIYGDEVELKETKTVAGNLSSCTFDSSFEPDPETQVHLFDSLSVSPGWKSGAAEIESVRFLDEQDKPLTSLIGGEAACLVIRARARSEINSPILGFFVKDRLGQSLFGEHTFTYVNPPLSLFPGEICEAKFYFRIPFLPNGDYAMTVSIAEGTPWDHVQHHWIHDAVIFKVVSNKLRYGLVGIPFQAVSLHKLI